MKPFLTALLVASCSLAALAEVPVVPNAGSILQQIKPVTPASPWSPEVDLTIEHKDTRALSDGVPFLVKNIRVTGNFLFDTATLHALVADAEGHSLTLAQLGELAARVTNYYHIHGYALAQVIIPAQVIADGVVVIEVLEARYGEIWLENHSRVRNSFLQATLSPLESGKAIEQSALDHALLLLSDIPGVAVIATLKPGVSTSTADLLVVTAPPPSNVGEAVVDNYGNVYTGRTRLNLTVNFNNPLRLGDVLSLSGLSSGRGLNYGRVAYEALSNGRGTRLGGSYSVLHYTLGGPLAALEAHGSVQMESLWAKHPFARSRNFNLYGQIQYDSLQLRDHIDASAIQTDRHLENWMASLAGDARDSFLNGGITIWRLDWTEGQVGFDNAAAQLADATTAVTQGGFSKIYLSLSRLQNIGPKDGLYLSLSGQWANTNLDSSQKLIAGGPYSVRAYDMAAISGDTGFVATVEFRHDLDPIWHSQWQAVAFIDTAQVTINQTSWAGGANRATLSGVGVGFNWAGPKLWRAKISLATPIGSTPVMAPAPGLVRGWLELSKAF